MSKHFSYGRNALIINLRGDIDQYAAAQIKETIDLEIENSPKKNILFNLQDVTLMDSSGIGLIVGRYKIVASMGGKVAICNASKNVAKMLKLSGIEKIAPSYNTLKEAEKSLATEKGR